MPHAAIGRNEAAVFGGMAQALRQAKFAAKKNGEGGLAHGHCP
jgi:hypothetical protein